MPLQERRTPLPTPSLLCHTVASSIKKTDHFVRGHDVERKGLQNIGVQEVSLILRLFFFVRLTSIPAFTKTSLE